MGPREALLRQQIETAFNPDYYELENESHSHSVPVNSETHFRLLVVSSAFEGKSRIDRSRMINEVVKDEMTRGLHALSQRTMTPSEWAAIKDTFVMVSPACRGGSKRELG
jgi:stress-induced morphogen